MPRPLTASGVQYYAPAVAGVYGITNSREWIYVGQTDDIRKALEGHLQDWEAPLMKREPTGFVFEACSGDQRRARRDRLVLEYAPVCNWGPSLRGGSALRKRQHAK